VLYVVAKGGTPKGGASEGVNDAIALLAVLGSTPPKTLTVNEFTTVASVWTSAQFLEGDPISPPGGYVGGGMQAQVDIDIDPAGNVWVSNNWQDFDAALGRVPEELQTLGAGQGIVVFYGMAKPVRTPLIGPVREP
jgi:hypothetical protein